MHKISKIDETIQYKMRKFGLPILQYSIAFIFIWFGGLKPFGLSPAQELVEKTVYFVDPQFFIPILGWWEVLIGICFLHKSLIRIGIPLLFLQLPGTFLPLVLLPEICFTDFPVVLTLEGQYIVKNMLIIGSALVIGGFLDPIKKQERQQPEKFFSKKSIFVRTKN